MQMSSIREFRKNMSKMTNSGDLVMLTSHGKMVGFYMPILCSETVPVEVKKDFIRTLGVKIATKFTEKGITEKEILNDFKAYKSRRR